MAEATHAGADSSMDINDQKQTFHGFLVTALWCCALIMMSVALFTIAFAMNLGWFPGLAAFAAIGVAVGLLFRMSGPWWAVLIASCVLMGIGGVVIPAIVGLMG
jgi:Bacterial aa3 type cytochrome c oxidase subunit IV